MLHTSPPLLPSLKFHASWEWIAAAQLQLSAANRTKAKLKAAILVQKDLLSVTGLSAKKKFRRISLLHYINIRRRLYAPKSILFAVSIDLLFKTKLKSLRNIKIMR